MLLQVAVHQVVGVVAMRHRFVAAAGAVPVSLLVSAAAVARGAGGRVLLRDRQLVLLDDLASYVVQVAVVQVIDVPLVLRPGSRPDGRLLEGGTGLLGPLDGLDDLAESEIDTRRIPVILCESK